MTTGLENNSIKNGNLFSASTLASKTLRELGKQYTLAHSALERTLRGLAEAAKLSSEQQERLLAWFSGQKELGDDEDFVHQTVIQWLATAEAQLSHDSEFLVLVNLVIGIAYMRERSRSTTLTEDEASISFIWPIIH